MSAHPSLDHLVRHQRDLADYKHNVSTSADGRFGVAWWGLWNQHVRLSPDATVVDLGVGSGAFLARLRERMPEARLVGFDLHPEMVQLAGITLDGMGVELHQADLALPLPLPDASVDAAVSSLTFHELPHPPDLLAHAARVVRPGGWLVLFDIVRWPLAAYMEGKELTRDTLDHFREHCLFSPDDLAWMVEHAGFDVQEVVTRSGGRFAMVIARRREG
ncbi:MAG: methyltransferase domain-containing protein [Myxococcales bacterium]|nr:methyltransferase domain-containing protein [Myxococcales bacterium]